MCRYRSRLEWRPTLRLGDSTFLRCCGYARKAATRRQANRSHPPSQVKEEDHCPGRPFAITADKERTREVPMPPNPYTPSGPKLAVGEVPSQDEVMSKPRGVK